MSCIHRILTRETYTGVHHYNCTDSRLNRQRPKGEWWRYLSADHRGRCLCAREGALLHKRRPTETPTRITKQRSASDRHRAHYESCGRPLMIRTGKSGHYRYCACAAHRLKGISQAKFALFLNGTGAPTGRHQIQKNQTISVRWDNSVSLCLPMLSRQVSHRS